MVIITSTGYHGTGSSAITDLLSEYDVVHPNSEFEIKLLYDYHGINDLFYYLTKRPIREVSNYAIRDFYKQCMRWATNGTSMNYEIYFNNSFMKYTKEYIDELGGKYFGMYYLADAFDNKAVRTFIYKAINKVYRTIYLRFIHKDHSESFTKSIPVFMEREPFYMHEVEEERFIDITRKYLRKLFSSMSDKPYMIVDHFVSTSTIDDCTRYLDDARVFVVDRDPRDIFLSARYRWRAMDIPSNDVNVFCDYYKWSREIPEHNDKSKIMRVQFEDLIFNYDETVSKIELWLGLSPDSHKYPKKRFDPKVSGTHCRLWEQYPHEKENIAIIENRLSKWLYS